MTRCLAGFPWFWPGRPLGEPAMVEARRVVRRHFGRGHHPLYRTIAQIIAMAVWPPAVLVNLWQIRHVLGSEVSIKRVPGAFWAAMRHNVLPGEYFAYGLWQRDRMMNVDNYLYSNEVARLFKVLNKPSQPNPLSDKMAFYELCKAHGIPTPEVLAAFAPTGRLVDFRFGLPPESDLFVKARAGLGGDGAERFRWNGVLFESNRSHRLRPENLSGYLATRAHAEGRTLLVQPVLSNHPDLHAVSSGALATARLVTGLSINGEIIPIFGYISFARANQITSLGNHLALIDVTNGQLMRAPPKNYPGAAIYDYRQPSCDEGGALPDWGVALKHIMAAHLACANFVFVGWDVAFTEQGPMVLEGNENWCADTYQTLRGKPLGFTKFAHVLATRLKD
jgi:Sugar-transfer associated ATP-grasp